MRILHTAVILSFVILGTSFVARAQNVENKPIYNHQKFLENEFNKQLDINRRENIPQEVEGKIQNLRVSNREALKNQFEQNDISWFQKLYLKSNIYVKNTWSLVQNRIAAWFGRASLVPTTLMNALNNRKSLSNLPPVVSSIRFDKLSSGASPVTRLYVNSMSDPDDGIAKIRWNFGDGTSVELLAGEFETDARIYHKFPTSGHYAVALEVEDTLGAITTIGSYVEFVENSQPAPYFTATPSLSNPLEVTFHILSRDQDEPTVDTWAIVCPSGGTANKEFTCVFPAAGDYELQLYSTDSESTKIMVSTMLTIGTSTVKSKPVAVLDIDKDWGSGPLTVTFDASASFDLDGSVVSYDWDFSETGRPFSRMSGQQVVKTFYQPGTYFVKLAVRDDLGNESVMYRDIHVSGGINPAIIAFNTAPLKVSFHGDRSALNVPLFQQMVFWDFGDGAKYKGTWPDHTYAAPGTYTVQVKIVSISGTTYNLSKVITIGGGVDSPNAGSIIPSHYSSPVFTWYSYSSNSTDPASSDPLTYRWVFFDGQVQDLSEVYKNYEEPGYKAVQLFVTNSRGFSSLTNTFSEVSTAYNVIFARTLFNPKVGSAPLTVSFDGTKSSASPGKIISHEWAINDQVVSFAPTMTNTFTTPGTYYVRYITTDSLGNQASTNEVVVVTSGSPPGGNLPPNAVLGYTVDGSNARRVYFNCFSSTDDQWVASCSWKLNGQSLQDTMSGQVVFSDNILYTLELTVYDRWGASSTASRQFDYRVAPIQVVDFDYAPLHPKIGVAVQFGAEQSVIPGRNITQYSWNFGDGNTGSGALVSHTYTVAGTYAATLTLVDTTLATHTITKNITVASVAPTTGLELLARASDGSGSIREGQTYKALRFPETIQFYAKANGAAEGVFSDGVWDFGNGEFGYGEQVEFTYFKPGIYTVTYSGKTPSNESVSNTLTIEIPERSCYRMADSNFCLSLNDQPANVLSLNEKEWNIYSNWPGLKFKIPSTPPIPRTYMLIAQDGSGTEIDIRSTMSPWENKLNIRKHLLDKLAINYSIPYRIQVRTILDDPGNVNQWDISQERLVVGESPEFYFGGAKLSFEVSETDAVIELFHLGSQRRIYKKLTGVDILELPDLAFGKYSVIAWKGSKKIYREIELSSLSEKNIVLDLDSAMILGKAPKNINAAIKTNLYATPSWAESLCGEPSPFAGAETRQVSSGESIQRSMTSASPSAQWSFQDVPRSMPRGMNLSCLVTTPSLLYAHSKWKYKTGPNRCYNQSNPHVLWNEYLKTLKRETSPITIVYEIRDSWTNEVVQGHFVTSARDLMNKYGLGLEDLTGRYGLAKFNESSKEWGLRAEYILPIPTHFKRPQVRFKLVSEHSSSNEDFYSVKCDVVANTGTPLVAELAPTNMAAGFHTASANARLALSKGYNFFPVQYDNRVGSAVDTVSTSATADFKLTIQRHDYKNVVWQGVNIQYLYGTQTYTKFYSFTGVAEENLEEKTYKNTISINTSDLAGKFVWESGVKKMQLKVTPVGKAVVDYDFTGASKSFSFIPLLDLQTVKISYPQICSEGFYGTGRTTFVRDDLISSLVLGEGAGAKSRCGDASTPFGGPIELSPSLRREGYEDGSMLNISYFNQSGMHDSYDDFMAPIGLKRLDIQNYIDFDAEIYFLAGMPGNITPNLESIYDYCHPAVGPMKEPCVAGTNIFDMNVDIVSRICLWYTSSGLMPAGCPATIDVSRMIRLSSWIQQNMSAMEKWKSVADVSFLLWNGQLERVQNVQLIGNLFIKGKINSAPLFRSNSAGDGFSREPLAACHLQSTGCVAMIPDFTFNSKFMNNMLVKTGWR